jgi:hypothetical protein
MKYGRWQDAMISQARIAEWYSTRDGQNYLLNFFRKLNDDHTPPNRLPVEGLAALQMRMVRNSEPIHVSYDSCELIDHARQTFEPEPVIPSDPFVPEGFCLLAKPMVIDDGPVTENRPWNAPSGLIPIRAIAWMAIHNEDYSAGAFWIGHYVDIEDELTIDPTDNRWVGTEALIHMRRFSPLSLVHQWEWTWGRGWHDDADYYRHLDIVGEDFKSARHRARQQLLLIQTLWRIGSQYVPTKQKPASPLRRDAKRKGLKKHEEVNVIVLRRTKPSNKNEPTGRHLTVQFPVNGYWAIRHTVDGPRQVWVKSHMKGDPDAPLVTKKRAWEFRR